MPLFPALRSETVIQHHSAFRMTDMEHREMEALPFRMHRWYFHTENTDRSTGCVGNLRGGDAVSLDNFMTLSELQKGLFTEGSVCFTIQVEITMKNKCRKESRFTDICIV